MREALKAAKIFVVKQRLSPDLEITRYVSKWMKLHRSSPPLLFVNVAGYPTFHVLMDPFSRDVLLSSLAVSDTDYLPTLVHRLRGRGVTTTTEVSHATVGLDSLYSLPVLRHQPRDAGRYITSAVLCLRSPNDRLCNLGIYRICVKGPRRCVVFLDRRTDAHRLLIEHWNAGIGEVPTTLYLGGPPATYLAAAGCVPATRDSYEFAAALGGQSISLAEDSRLPYPPAAAEAEIVIRGRITKEVDDEAPFGEFKGYYCKPTRSPVLVVDDIAVRPEAMYPGLFCGKESGLRLMSLTNEILMYDHLRSLGHEVSRVSYPLSAFGEFLALIESPRPTSDALTAALEFDKRAKMVVLSESIERPQAELSIFDFDAKCASYVKRGESHGHRIGILAARKESVDWVEF